MDDAFCNVEPTEDEAIARIETFSFLLSSTGVFGFPSPQSVICFSLVFDVVDFLRLLVSWSLFLVLHINNMTSYQSSSLLLVVGFQSYVDLPFGFASTDHQSFKFTGGWSQPISSWDLSFVRVLVLSSWIFKCYKTWFRFGCKWGNLLKSKANCTYRSQRCLNRIIWSDTLSNGIKWVHNAPSEQSIPDKESPSP